MSLENTPAIEIAKEICKRPLAERRQALLELGETLELNCCLCEGRGKLSLTRISIGDTNLSFQFCVSCEKNRQQECNDYIKEALDHWRETNNKPDQKSKLISFCSNSDAVHSLFGR